MENKNYKGTIILLLIVIILLAILIILAVKNKQNVENTINNKQETNSVNSELVRLSNCSNSIKSYNNINVTVEHKNENGVCIIDIFTINDKDIKSEVATYIDSYEFFDDKVIILSSDTSQKGIYIYDTKAENIILKLDNESLNDYKIESYHTDNNIIYINGKECGPQCGKEYTEYPRATFKIEYNNNSFGEIELVEKIKEEDNNDIAGDNHEQGNQEMNNPNSEEKKLNKEEFITKTIGKYSMCEKDESNLCNGIILTITEKEISVGKLHSDGSFYGDIDNVEFVSKDTYKVSFTRLKDSEDKINNIDYTSEDKHYTVELNLSNLTNHQIKLQYLNEGSNAIINKSYELEYIGKGTCALDKYLASKENYTSECTE